MLFDNDLLNTSGFIPHESSPDISQTSKKGGRQNNFTNEEDKLIVSAWLNVSLDPILGSGQKRTTFWAKVEQYFSDNKTWLGDRNSNSLMNRWSTINGAVVKFIGCYENIESLNRSGTNEDMRVSI